MKNKVWFKGNIYGMFLWRIIGLMLIYTISRILFVVFNPTHFSLSFGETIRLLIAGMRFDISTLAFINAIFIIWFIIPLKYRYTRFWKVIGGIFFYPINIIAIGSNLADIVYYRFILKRTTGEIFHFIHTEGKGFWPLVPQFFKDFYFVPLIWVILSILLVLWCNRFKLMPGRQLFRGIFHYIYYTISVVILMAIVVISMRGGLQLKPIAPITASEHAAPENVPVVLNTPFSILKTLGEQGVQVPDFYTEKELLSTFNPINYPKADSIRKPFKSMNVVIIILESFSAEHTKYFNESLKGYKGFTPFLDSLAAQSLSFKGWSNGKRSIEGIPAVTASLPSWMSTDYASSIYNNNKINSVASLLKEKGYHTSFFHGGNNGTMSFDVFAKIAGYDHYYGRNEYNNDKDFDGKWGIFDEPFLQYFSRNLSTFPKPFVTTIFTLSSHHPYTIPPKYKGVFRKGKLPIQQAVMYSDNALRKFFDTAKKQDWFKNTLFVLTADHTSEAAIPFYETTVGQYNIPIIFYTANDSIRSMADSHLTVQQADILPSIMDYLNYDNAFFAFGNSAFDSTAVHFGMSYINNTYQMIQGEYALQFNGEKNTGLYHFTQDSTLKTDLVDSVMSIQKPMEKLVKTLIQEYNYSLVNNQMTANPNKNNE
ncbi:MAG: LTA synthase family protein [Hyphomicrobiales bacterium]